MKICIDAGHGGTDPGAIGPSGLREKNITLAIAQKVAAILMQAGVVIKLTRQNDTYVGLDARCRMANEWGADYFISIHCNSAVNQQANGTETYCLVKGGRGEKLASSIQEELAKLGRQNRGVKTARYYVLRKTSMPATLAEVAFISNPAEEKLLASQEFQDKAAEAVAVGIAKIAGIQIKKKEDDSVTDTKVIFRGKELDGFIRDGKTYVEVRRLCETLGLKVNWNPKTRNVEVM